MADAKRYFVKAEEAGVDQNGQSSNKVVGEYNAGIQALAFGIPAKDVLNRAQRRKLGPRRGSIKVGAGLGNTTDINQIDA